MDHGTKNLKSTITLWVWKQFTPEKRGNLAIYLKNLPLECFPLAFMQNFRHWDLHQYCAFWVHIKYNVMKINVFCKKVMTVTIVLHEHHDIPVHGENSLIFWFEPILGTFLVSKFAEFSKFLHKFRKSCFELYMCLWPMRANEHWKADQTFNFLTKFILNTWYPHERHTIQV